MFILILTVHGLIRDVQEKVHSHVEIPGLPQHRLKRMVPVNLYKCKRSSFSSLQTHKRFRVKHHFLGKLVDKLEIRRDGKKRNRNNGLFWNSIHIWLYSYYFETICCSYWSRSKTYRFFCSNYCFRGILQYLVKLFILLINFYIHAYLSTVF